DFSGVVTAIDAGQWQVAGLALMVPEDTLGAHDIIISDVVAVQARTTSAGSLIAERITLIEPGNEPPVPTQNLTPTLSPTLTGTPTPTPTSTSPPPTLTFTVTPVTAQSGAAPDDGCVVDAPAGWVIYQVRSGDTLSSLAAQTSVPVEQLMQINCLDDAHLIVAGQSIWLPFDIAPPPTPLPARAGGGPDSGSRGSGGSHSDDGDDDDDDSRGPAGSTTPSASVKVQHGITGGGFISAEVQAAGFEVVVPVRFSDSLPLQVFEQVRLAGYDAGVNQIVGRVGPGVTRRWIAFRQRALDGGFPNPVIRPQFKEAGAAFDIDVGFREAFDLGAAGVAHFAGYGDVFANVHHNSPD